MYCLCLCKLIADLHGYVRGLLGVEGAIFNVIPFARALDIPTEAMDQVIKSCNDDDQQLEIILNHWSKEKDVPENPAALRKAAEGSKQGLLLEMFTFSRTVCSGKTLVIC